MARMYHTEEEAKALWCPMSAASGDGQKCLASDCMAWRESTYGKEADKHGTCGLVAFVPDRA